MNLKEKLILGTVQMGIPYGISNSSGQISLEESHTILNLAWKNGIRLLDTAESYGNAHEVIGLFHRLNPEIKFKVITKLPSFIDSEIALKVGVYLRELEVDHLEAIFFHSFSTYANGKEFVEDLNILKEKGITRFIGVSIYTNDEFEKVIEDDLIDVIQLPYNLLDNVNLRGDLLKRAKERGKMIHSRSCFLQGLFFQSPNSDKKIVQLLSSELNELNLIAKKNKMSLQQMALSYCIEESLIDNVLIGVDSSDQLMENIRKASGINSTVKNEINNIQVQDIKLLNPSLWSSL